MSRGNTDTGEKFAILIGINFYLRHKDSTSRVIRNLSGAVKDANTMETLLTSKGVRVENIRKLTSEAPEAHDSAKDPPGVAAKGDPANQPTYVNIRAALEEFITDDDTKRKGKPGDIVYFTYSGHGSRTSSGGTAYPEEEWKGPRAYDESLVPSDADLTGQLLDDVTLAYLFNKMAKVRELKLTVILDCCHAGGATRAPPKGDRRFTNRTYVLGPNQRYRAFTMPEEYKIQRTALFEAWKAQRARDGRAHRGALINPSGYQLFAACHDHEYAIDDGDGGVLTLGLKRAFKDLEDHNVDPDVPQSMLLRKVDDGIQNIVEQANMLHISLEEPPAIRQVPIMEGQEGYRFFSGSVETTKEIATIRVRVQGLAWGREEFVLAAGASHGVKVGDVYAIYQWYERATTDANHQPQVRVTAVHPLCSDVKFLDGHQVPAEKEGWHAVLLTHAAPFKIDGFTAEELAHITRYKTILDLKNTGKRPQLRNKISIEIQPQREGNSYKIKPSEHAYTLHFRSSAAVPVYLTCFNLSPEWAIFQLYPRNSDYDVIYPGEHRIITFKTELPPKQEGEYVEVIKCWVTTRPMPTTGVPIVPGPVSFRSFEMPELRDGIDSPVKLGMLGGDDTSTAGTGAEPLVTEGEWDTVKIDLRFAP